jgi:fumarylacetoacetase
VPIQIARDEWRAFLEDGDEITLRAWCEKDGAARIGFGSAQGRLI